MKCKLPSVHVRGLIQGRVPFGTIFMVTVSVAQGERERASELTFDEISFLLRILKGFLITSQ